MTVGCAAANLEAVQPFDLGNRHVDAGDLRGRRRVAAQVVEERLERPLASLNVNAHAVVAVQHPAIETMRASQTEHMRAEPDALDDAADVDAACDTIGAAQHGHEASGLIDGAT